MTDLIPINMRGKAKTIGFVMSYNLIFQTFNIRYKSRQLRQGNGFYGNA